MRFACREMSRDAPKKIYTNRIWRSLEHRKCPRFAPRARNSPRVPEIRVACPRFRVAKTPSDDEPFHTFFSLSPPQNTFLFWNPHRDIIYILYILLFNTPCISASVILDSGTFSDISDVLATAKFEMSIFLGASRDISARKAHLGAHLGVLDRAVS